MVMTRFPDTLATKPHGQLCKCGGMVTHRHAPITPEHAAWCRWLASRGILGEAHRQCARAFPGVVAVREK